MVVTTTLTAAAAVLSPPPTAIADDRWLFAKGMRLSARRDEVLFSEGEAAHSVYRIVSGTIRLVKVMIDGRRHILDFLLPGDLVGLHCGSTYGNTAEALTNLEWIRYSRTWIDSELDQNPRVGRRLHELASQRLAAAQNQMLLLGRMTARERLATFLLNLERRLDAALERRPGTDDAVDRGVPLAMTRFDIADHLGLTLETISRSFNQLKRDGVIDLPHPQRVCFVDPDRLRELACGSQPDEGVTPIEAHWHVLAMLGKQGARVA